MITAQSQQNAENPAGGLIANNPEPDDQGPRNSRQYQQEADSRGAKASFVARFSNWLGDLKWDRTRKVSSLEGIVNLPRVNALIHFVSERGLDPGAKLIKPLHDAVAVLGLVNTRGEFIAADAKVMMYYSQLCELTYPTMGVNGRTIIDTQKAWFHMGGLILWSLLFVICAFATEVFQQFESSSGLFSGLLTPEIAAQLKGFFRAVMEPLSPFFWGGVGSCVFLLKTVSDRIVNLTFDAQKLNRYVYLTRIILGAILGFVIVNLLFSKTELATVSIGPEALAFLTGLSVKVVYGGLETLIETAYKRIGRGANPATGDQEQDGGGQETAAEEKALPSVKSTT